MPLVFKTVHRIRFSDLDPYHHMSTTKYATCDVDEPPATIAGRGGATWTSTLVYTVAVGKWSARVLVLILWAPVFTSGCTKACGDVGCQDQVRATVATASGAFPSGMHKIEVTSDGVVISCAFAFPLATLSSGGTASPSCPAGLTVDVLPATICTSSDTDAAKTIQCAPVSSQFVEQIAVLGKPVQVRVQQSIDGTGVLDQTVTPSYQSNQPNGAGCAPTCQLATEAWTLPG